MDSELLSVFRDDQFESSCNKFEENYWNVVNCENFATHLSDSLNGILPISPIEEKIACFGTNLHDGSYSNSIAEINNINIADSHQDFNYSETNSNIEIMQVDSNAEFDSSECDKNVYGNDSENGSDHDNKSQVTFRSRTDSSSIGDYESHTSDESEAELPNNSDFNLLHQPICINEVNTFCSTNSKNIGNEIDVNSRDNTIINHIDFVGSSVTVSTNNSKQSIEIDTEAFDLPTFITEDNFLQTKLSENSSFSNDKPFNYIYGYESEEIIDIETVDDHNTKHPNLKKDLKSNTKVGIQNEASTIHTNNLFEEDDIKGDPSWDPSYEKKNKNSIEKLKEKQVRNMENKLNKNLIKEVKTSKSILTKKKIQKKMNNDRKNNSAVKKPSGKQELKYGRFNDSNFNEHLELFECPVKWGKDNVTNTKEQSKSDHNKRVEKHCFNTNLEVPTKKKLNLQEYYKMRQGEQKDLKSSSTMHSATVLENIITPTNNFKEPQNGRDQFSTTNSSVSNSLLITKDLFNANFKLSGLDPITEAKNKVLRLQEMKKRAAQKRLIDITVSSKVGPVTKILPLEEIIKPGLKNLKKEKPLADNSIKQIEYEEIIIVSVSCNTDIKIPPKLDKIPVNSTSTSLLYNISNTIEKVKSKENLKISNNSLITSIKNVVLQKTVQDNQEKCVKIINCDSKLGMKQRDSKISSQNFINEHGEDKIIMHLPKNRIKEKMMSVATQTELLPGFPSLELVMSRPRKTRQNRENKNRKYKYKKEDYSSFSSDSDRESDTEFNINVQTNRYRSHSRSTGGSRQISPSDNYTYNYPDSKLKSDLCDLDKNRYRSRHKPRRNMYRTRKYSGSDHSTSSSYRSRSSSYSDRSESRSSRNYIKKERRSKTIHKNYKTKNKSCQRESSPAVEERRIVYVGRIEAETTKEDLKRKFIGYGAIKQITLHYKDTGMKYGFVTFEKAEDAFKAIDNGTTDLKINMYDISFGGRRAFCRQSYADLDGAATNTFQLYSYGSVPSSRNSLLSNNDVDDSFESLLKKVKQKLSSTKPSSQKT